jgi:putative endonuclease
MTEDAGMTTSDPTADYFVYVLRNGDGTLYTGIAKDVDGRCAAHNAGKGARFTRGRGPWAVAHIEGPLAHGDALRREAALKRDRRFKNGLKQAPADAASKNR